MPEAADYAPGHCRGLSDARGCANRAAALPDDADTADGAGAPWGVERDGVHRVGIRAALVLPE